LKSITDLEPAHEIGSIYDRHRYADENKRIMEAVAHHLISLATGGTADKNIVQFGTRN
jgi:hypothetical protein